YFADNFFQTPRPARLSEKMPPRGVPQMNDNRAPSRHRNQTTPRFITLRNSQARFHRQSLISRQSTHVQGLTNSADSRFAFTARLWPRCKSPAASAFFAWSMNCFTWLTTSCWLALSVRSATFFRFCSVATVSCSVVERCSEACSAVVSPLSSTMGSSAPPFFTTFFGGGHGFAVDGEFGAAVSDAAV